MSYSAQSLMVYCKCHQSNPLYHSCIALNVVRRFFFTSAFRIFILGILVISYQGFLKLKCPVWVSVCAQQNRHGNVWAAAASHHSLCAGLCTCTRVSGSCAPILARSLNFPFRHSRNGVWQPPPGQSNAYFAKRKHKPIPGISISRNLGMGSHTKMPSMGFEVCI